MTRSRHDDFGKVACSFFGGRLEMLTLPPLLSKRQVNTIDKKTGQFLTNIAKEARE